MRDSVVCTLFENTYHVGLAALTNSLIDHGFKGTIYAGYKGSLPPWTKLAIQCPENADVLKLEISTEVDIHFVLLTTSFHLSNYKPDFMLGLMNGLCMEAKRIYYFDPDIVITNEWENFEDWVCGGIALCEDVNSPVPRLHPTRVGWRNYFKKHSIDLEFKDSMYANAGYIGLKREDIGFLEKWALLQTAMGQSIGGLGKSTMPYGDFLTEENLKAMRYFSCVDQDAMNASIEAWNGDVSFIGKEAMEIHHGKSFMSHAFGHPKPWNKSFIGNSLKGIGPTRQDRRFWDHINFLIKPYSNAYVRFKKISMGIAIIINRFYNKS